MMGTKRIVIIATGIGVAIAVGIGISIAHPTTPPVPSPSTPSTPPTVGSPIPTETVSSLEEWAHYEGLESDMEEPDPPFANLSFDHWVIARSPDPQAIAIAQEFYDKWMADTPQDRWIQAIIPLLSEHAKPKFREIRRSAIVYESQSGEPVQRSVDQTGEDVTQIAVPTQEGSWVATMVRIDGAWKIEEFVAAVPVDMLIAP